MSNIIISMMHSERPKV